jgi:DNA (cytosine-5)-methyltransferase 1
MRVLDLFSGIGGFSLGLERAGMKTAAFCEIDPFCRKVLAKHWPGVPIHDDIRELDGEQYRGAVDVVCGGWPCQTFSSAAHGNNVHPDMWPEYERVIRTARPRWVIAENVSRVRDVRNNLEDCGYAASRWQFPLPFRGHVRDRVYFVAHADRDSESLRAVDEEMAKLLEVAGFGWDALPRVVGVDDGLPRKMDRLRALGNAVIPFYPELIGRAIMATIS